MKFINIWIIILFISFSLCEGNNSTIIKLIFNLICFNLDYPNISEFAFSKNVKVGQKSAATCITSGKAPFEFKWLKDSKLINLSRVKVKTEQDYSVIVIDSVSSDDEGNYTCIASNDFGENRFTSFLKVKGICF